MTAQQQDPMSQVLNAGLKFARVELAGRRLDPDELRVLDLCDDIGGVRDVAEHERRQSGQQVVQTEERILQFEEDIKAWEDEQSRHCPSSGQDVGKMIYLDWSDDWKIECPTCRALWWSGSTVLPEHNRPGR